MVILCDLACTTTVWTGTVHVTHCEPLSCFCLECVLGTERLRRWRWSVISGHIDLEEEAVFAMSALTEAEVISLWQEA